MNRHQTLAVIIYLISIGLALTLVWNAVKWVVSLLVPLGPA